MGHRLPTISSPITRLELIHHIHPRVSVATTNHPHATFLHYTRSTRTTTIRVQSCVMVVIDIEPLNVKNFIKKPPPHSFRKRRQKAFWQRVLELDLQLPKLDQLDNRL